MFGLKKKDNMNKLPELSSSAPSMRGYQRPQLPPIEPFDEEKEEIHGLPSFPDSPMSKGFSQSAIKSAIGEPSTENSDNMKEWNQDKEDILPLPPPSAINPRTIEMDEWRPSQNPPIPRHEEMRMMPQMSSADQKRPLFIKLEKFREARDALTKITEKLDQMDELLKMIKEVKVKEEEELTSWERDIEGVKARISFVNKEIFENAF